MITNPKMKPYLELDLNLNLHLELVLNIKASMLNAPPSWASTHWSNDGPCPPLPRPTAAHRAASARIGRMGRRRWNYAFGDLLANSVKVTNLEGRVREFVIDGIDEKNGSGSMSIR